MVVAYDGVNGEMLGLEPSAVNFHLRAHNIMFYEATGGNCPIHSHVVQDGRTSLGVLFLSTGYHRKSIKTMEATDVAAALQIKFS